jgi:glycosyltransferase involved in cell wall biosynthesis
VVRTHVKERGGSGVKGSGRPRVSLCIPAYQAERYLRETLDSCLAQDYPDFEVVVIDNNSSDGTRDILASVKDERVRVIRNETTLPLVENWNLAVRMSRGEFVKLVCADDVLEPDCVAEQSAILGGSPEVSLVSSRIDFIDSEGQLLRRARGLGGIVGHHPGERVVRQLVRTGSYPVGPAVAVMFRRADFDRIGGFAGDLVLTNDIDLWVRLLRCGDFFGVARTLGALRFTIGGLTSSMSMRSQLAQRSEFVRRLAADPRWNVTVLDRVLGHFNRYDMQLRLSVLYKWSALRSRSRRRQQVGTAHDDRRMMVAPSRAG